MYAVDWSQITGGSLLISATIVALAVGLFRLSPMGSATVQTLKDLLEATKAELDLERGQRDSALEALDIAKEEIATFREQVAILSQRPDTTALALAISNMNAGFDQHRNDLTSLLSTLVESNKKLEEGMASNTQALVLLVDRNRARREGEA